MLFPVVGVEEVVVVELWFEEPDGRDEDRLP